MTTAIYARQSINKKDSISIETQIEICRKEIKDNSQIKIYEDKGFSGKNTSRPSFQQMMSDVKQGLIQNIVVYRLDRISRSVVDFANIIDILNKHKVDFISANEKFDTSSPAGKAMLYIIMVFAQMERETIAERIKDNYYQRGSDGVWLGGPAPFGYNNIKINIDGKKVATITENGDIELVKWLFEEYAKPEMSLGQLARQLVKDRNEMWNNIKLSRILHNPVYVKADVDVYNYYLAKGCIIKSGIDEFTGINGLNIYGKRDRALNKYNNIKDHNVTVGLHNGVIPSSLFLQVQYKLGSNKQIKNNGKGKHTWLTGLVKCGYCNRAMVVRTYKDIKYFNCSGRAIQCCDGEISTHYVSDIEDLVFTKLKHYIDNFAECKVNEVSEYNEVSLNEIKIKLSKVEKQIENIVNNLTNSNPIMVKYANEKIVKLDAERNDLLSKINELNTKKELPLILPDLTNWKIRNNDFKHGIANNFINKVFVYADKVEIDWKY